ncbi:MAG: glycosyltransferase [Nitrospirae bacterium]|nr:glycosyltransferase [Nitrospirota bacterium]
MRALSLADLPAPPAGKTGWPWTEESDAVPETPTLGGRWPRITVVTPSLNQGRFIEATIRSVLLQRYPNTEYFIMDGGSTDATVEIIRKYEPFLSGWVSETDQGQADAINKGLRRSTGDIEGYQNSDDGYLPGAFRRVAESRLQGCDFIYGNQVEKNVDGRVVRRNRLPNIHPRRYVLYASGSLFPEACFWSREIRQSIGWFKENRYSLDTDWFYRVTEKIKKPRHLDEYLAWFTEHPGRKTQERDANGVRIGLQYADHPLKDYLRERGISRFRQFLGAMIYIPLKRIHYGRFPVPFPTPATVKRFFKR